MNTVKIIINQQTDDELKRLYEEIEKLNNERDCTLVNKNHKYKTLNEHYEIRAIFLKDNGDKVLCEMTFDIPHFLGFDLEDIKYLMIYKFRQKTNEYASIYSISKFKYEITEIKMSYADYINLITQLHKLFPMIIDDEEFNVLNDLEMFKTLFI